MNRDSKIWLSKNIKLDKDYRAVLNYSESELIQLMENQNNLVYYNNKYQFLRDTGEIIVQAPYGVVIQANYLAYQNPDYSNKIFFAFIDSVEYVSEKATRIRFTNDVWSTWFSYWDAKACYVIREHVTDDTVGLHTIPEGLETGEYIINDADAIDFRLGQSTFICMGVSKAGNLPSVSPYDRQYGGIYSGLTYYLFDSPENCSKMIQAYDDIGASDAIYCIFLIPTLLSFANQWYTVSLGNQTDIKVSAVKTSTDPVSMVREATISLNNSLNGYTPVNKKLLCYPYNYLYITNNCGGDVIYHYEDFVDNTPKFNIDGMVSVGCSIKLYPLNYKKYNAKNVDQTWNNLEFSYGLMSGKYATCSWISDVFTNWLTQNAVNIGIQSVIGATEVALGAATGEGKMAATGGIKLANTVGSIYQASLVPPQAKGDVNGGDITMASNRIGFDYNKMSIKAEYARMLDNYFTRQGYKVNRLKIPNMGHRQNYNYIQIAEEDNVAYINNYNGICPPSKDIESINNLFRRGITIWNNHNNLGDYSVSNNITN